MKEQSRQCCTELSNGTRKVTPFLTVNPIQSSEGKELRLSSNLREIKLRGCSSNSECETLCGFTVSKPMILLAYKYVLEFNSTKTVSGFFARKQLRFCLLVKVQIKAFVFQRLAQWPRDPFSIHFLIRVHNVTVCELPGFCEFSPI